MRSIYHVIILLSVLILTLDLMLKKLLRWDLVGTHWEFVGTQWELSGSMVGVDRELIGSSYGAGTELVGRKYGDLVDFFTTKDTITFTKVLITEFF